MLNKTLCFLYIKPMCLCVKPLRRQTNFQKHPRRFEGAGNEFWIPKHFKLAIYLLFNFNRKITLGFTKHQNIRTFVGKEELS
jgi:hypothetical protein